MGSIHSDVVFKVKRWMKAEPGPHLFSLLLTVLKWAAVLCFTFERKKKDPSILESLWSRHWSLNLTLYQSVPLDIVERHNDKSLSDEDMSYKPIMFRKKNDGVLVLLIL